MKRISNIRFARVKEAMSYLGLLLAVLLSFSFNCVHNLDFQSFDLTSENKKEERKTEDSQEEEISGHQLLKKTKKGKKNFYVQLLGYSPDLAIATLKVYYRPIVRYSLACVGRPYANLFNGLPRYLAFHCLVFYQI